MKRNFQLLVSLMVFVYYGLSAEKVNSGSYLVYNLSAVPLTIKKNRYTGPVCFMPVTKANDENWDCQYGGSEKKVPSRHVAALKGVPHLWSSGSNPRVVYKSKTVDLKEDGHWVFTDNGIFFLSPIGVHRYPNMHKGRVRKGIVDINIEGWHRRY